MGPGKEFYQTSFKISNRKIKLVEIDKECLILKNKFSNIEKHLIYDDFLNIDLKAFKEPLSIIGNFLTIYHHKYYSRYMKIRASLMKWLECSS